jgi:hypothetical protein
MEAEVLDDRLPPPPLETRCLAGKYQGKVDQACRGRPSINVLRVFTVMSLKWVYNNCVSSLKIVCCPSDREEMNGPLPLTQCVRVDKWRKNILSMNINAFRKKECFT